jgi:hypothetical protein
MVPLKHNSSNGKLNKASLARLIAKCLLKTAYIVDYTRFIIELVDKTDIYIIQQYIFIQNACYILTSKA